LIERRVSKEEERIMSKAIKKVEKTDVEKSDETTWAAKTYEPAVDIWETADALALAADVPGVTRDKVELDLRDDTLTIRAEVGADAYEGLRPLYGEYNIGNFYRRFSLGEVIDREKISADLKDGVLTVTLPKREKAKPRKIVVA
jgi:HSP20 family protein